MGHYLINFTAYTLAMVGVIFMCLIVYKKCFMDGNRGANQDFLKVENCLNLTPRKSIYVLRAGNEKFLIASDVEQTSFLARLEDKDSTVEASVSKALKTDNSNAPKRVSLEGVSISTDFYPAESNVTKLPVMKELMRKLNSQRG